MEIIALIEEYLGPLGPIILAGVLGLVMIVLVIIMMLREPEDPLTKLKRAAQDSPVGVAVSYTHLTLPTIYSV